VRAGLVGAAALLLALTACSSSGSGGSDDTGAPPPSSSSGGGGGSSAAAPAGGFQVNTDDCEDPDAVKEQVTGEWKIGYSLPLSGPVAGVVSFARHGYDARIAAQNAAGGIDGVQLKIIYKDDAFTPDRAKANVTEFVQKDKVDSLTTFGSGPTGAMADDQNAACVPLLYPSSSVAAYRNIDDYPWTVQFLPSADKEAEYDVKLIQQKFPSGATVGIFENQTESGKGYSQAFQKAVKGSNVKISVIAPSTDPNAAATQIKSKSPDVVYIAGITNDCGPDVQAMQRIGFKPKLVINPSNCADETGYIAAGTAADGGVLPSYLKNPADPALADDPGVKEYLSQVKTADKNNTITVAGWTTADLTINTLKQAAQMPGGLTRANVLKAARDQDYKSPMLINGISWVSSPTDLLGVSGFQTMKWDAAAKTFKADGAPISLK
jgi:ABC-type branched-subunit amino acid transport system substrate-binding protein